MNEIVKVSIGSVAFSLDVNAHQTLEKYLESLVKHYESNPNKDEIMDGIEERIAELIMEKIPSNAVVYEPLIISIIDILGSPNQIDDEQPNNQAIKEEKNHRKLYRNLSNKVLGGVVSGLATYFKIDVAILRIAFCLVTLITTFITDGFSLATAFLIYLILWLCIPAAKTVQQKCEMYGESPSLDNIRKSVEDGTRNISNEVKDLSKSDFWRGVGRAVQIILGIGFILSGLAALAILLLGVLSSFMWEYIISVPMISVMYDFLATSILSTLALKIIIALALLIPIFMFNYIGVLLIFNLKSPKWKPGLILLVIWIILLALIASVTASTFFKYERADRGTLELEYKIQSDTLYVEFEDANRYKSETSFMRCTGTSFELSFMDEEKLILYPDFRIRRTNQKTDSTNVLTVKTVSIINTNNGNLIEFEDFKDELSDFYEIKGNVLRIKPQLVEFSEELDVLGCNCYVYFPENMKIILREPINFKFDYSHKQNRPSAKLIFKLLKL